MIGLVPPVTDELTTNAMGEEAYAPARVMLTAVGNGPPELVTVPDPKTASIAVSIVAAEALCAMVPVVPIVVPVRRLMRVIVNVPPVGVPRLLIP